MLCVGEDLSELRCRIRRFLAKRGHKTGKNDEIRINSVNIFEKSETEGVAILKKL